MICPVFTLCWENGIWFWKKKKYFFRAVLCWKKWESGPYPTPSFHTSFISSKLLSPCGTQLSIWEIRKIVQMISAISCSPNLFQCGRWGRGYECGLWHLTTTVQTLPLLLSLPICKIGIIVEGKSEVINANHGSDWRLSKRCWTLTWNVNIYWALWCMDFILEGKNLEL